MSDERLREAERRWRETGAVEDEARYLLERVRVGDLTRERLELAAYCGHEGADEALAHDRGLPPQDPAAFADSLARWPEAASYVAIAVAEEVVRRHDATIPYASAERSALAAAIDYEKCPCEAHRARAIEAAGLIPAGFTPQLLRNAKLTVRSAAMSVAPGEEMDRLGEAVFHAQVALPGGDRELSAAMIEAALRWALKARTSSPAP